MTIEIMILVLLGLNSLVLIRATNVLFNQNEELRQEIRELKTMLKDRVVHVTHKIRE